MFQKPYRVKSNVPLKGSDTKRLRQRVEKAFPDVTSEQLTALLPTKATVSLLKLSTHSEFQTSVFCIDKLPYFFEIEGGVLVPTLYALWQLPELLPYFTTFKNVLLNLYNGADLMAPGIVPLGTGINIYGRFKKNQLMAINLTSNKSAVAVGVLSRSSEDLYMAGGRGAAVKILHVFGDKLWNQEPALAQQVPQLQRSAPLSQNDFPALGAKPEQEKPASLADMLAEPSAQSALVAELAEVKLQEPAEQVSGESNEDLLKQAFLTALKNHGKTLQLPLLTSNFFRLYMVPAASQPLDLKKTRFKKLSNFLSEMVDQNFIVVREEAKGVFKITSIDFEHAELLNFITDYKPASSTDAQGNPEQPLFHSSLTEMYLVSDATAGFFTKMNYKRGEGIPVAQVKNIVREYISKNNLALADATTRAVFLDETLQQLCGGMSATPRDISKTITQLMDHTYQMTSGKDVSNNKPCIQMSLATRSGNKKVTLVSNIECYGIIMSEFMKLCKQGAAASTTIVKLPNNKREQLQIQGNQVRFVYNLLTETYKVSPKSILGLELAKEKKKTKK